MRLRSDDQYPTPSINGTDTVEQGGVCGAARCLALAGDRMAMVVAAAIIMASVVFFTGNPDAGRRVMPLVFEIPTLVQGADLQEHRGRTRRINGACDASI